MTPRWLETLLLRLLPSDMHDEIIGDLEELTRRRADRFGPVGARLLAVADAALLVASIAARRLIQTSRHGFGGTGSQLRVGFRLLRKQPGLSATAVLSLALGIGLSATAFGVVQQALFGTLPVDDGDRFVSLEIRDTRAAASVELGRERLASLRTRTDAFEQIGALTTAPLNVALRSGEVEVLRSAGITPGLLGRVSGPPLLGRTLEPGDGAPSGERTVVISEGLWRRAFGSDKTVIGRRLDVAGERATVVGVLPSSTRFPNSPDLWWPLDEAEPARDARDARLVGILAPDVTPDDARSRTEALLAAIPGANGDAVESVDVRSYARPALGAQAGGLAAASVAIPLLLLLVVAANVATLLVARTSQRTAELAVRSALGASRARIVAQLVIESAVIGGLAAALGAAGAARALALYDGLLDELPFWIDLHLDLRTFAFVTVLTVLATAVVGVLPALGATRSGATGALRAAGAARPRGVGRLGRAMIAVEVALCVALLGAALVFARGFASYVTPRFTIPPDRILAGWISYDGLPADAEAEDWTQGVRQSLLQLPTVTGVSLADRLPGASPRPVLWHVDGADEGVWAGTVQVGAGFFDVLGARPLAGRVLVDADLRAGAQPVALVNASFAQAHFGTTAVVGRQVREARSDPSGPARPWREIVGVVPDLMEISSGPTEGIYVPLARASALYVALATTSSPLEQEHAVRAALYAHDPGIRLHSAGRLEDLSAEDRKALLVLASGLGFTALMTGLLSLAGIYALVALEVTQRTREIGIRVAMGASRKSVLRAVLSRALLLVAAGAGGGTLLGSLLIKARGIFVFALAPAEGWMFPALTLVFVTCALIACYVPLRRALTIEPTEALRFD